MKQTLLLWVAVTAFYLMPVAGASYLLFGERFPLGQDDRAEIASLLAGMALALIGGCVTAVILIRRRIREKRPSAVFRYPYRTELVSI